MKKLVWATVTAAALAASGVANAQEDLAKKDGCMNCHDVSTKKVGPAFKDVAAKFKGKADAEATLVAKLKEGKGHPATKASDNDLKGIVKWVLAQ
ncbi:MAG: c-type cytochrome [Casimicrobiaceae bacterium]